MESNTMQLTSVDQYNRAVETFNGGAAVLVANQTTVSKALSVGQTILNKIQANNGVMTAELDQMCNDYLAKINIRSKELQEARKPLTQIMDEVKKLFTNEESRIDIKRAGTVPALIQEQRNIYVRQLKEEEEKRRKDAETKQAKANEVAQIKSTAQTRQFNYFSAYLLEQKRRLQEKFNELTLDTFEERRVKIIEYIPVYPYEHFKAFNAQIARGMYHTVEETNAIVTDATVDKFTEFSDKYKADMADLRDQLVMALPSKKKELEALAQADEEEKERIERERIEREQQEADRMRKQAEEDEAAQQQIIQNKIAEETTMNMFESVAELAVEEQAPETRQGYEIKVLHHAGYAMIFQFWLENEGKSLSLEKVGNTKMDQMKAYCEKMAHKNGTKIESQYLKYEPTYKAVNRVSK